MECVREHSEDIANMTLGIKKGRLKKEEISRCLAGRKKDESVKAQFIDKEEPKYLNLNFLLFCLGALHYQEIAFYVHYACKNLGFVFVFMCVTMTPFFKKINLVYKCLKVGMILSFCHL